MVSALVRAQQLVTYGEPVPDASDLAAAYAYGLSRNDGLSDGNKRTAWEIARVFLLDDGESIDYTEVDAIHMMQDTAADTISEQALAQWFRHRLHSIVR